MTTSKAKEETAPSNEYLFLLVTTPLPFPLALSIVDDSIDTLLIDDIALVVVAVVVVVLAGHRVATMVTVTALPAHISVVHTLFRKDD